jgi:hypothetical protein
MGRLRETTADYATAEWNRVHQIERRLQRFVREQPFKSALLGASFVAAIGAGILLGRLWMHRDHSQWMRSLPWR